MTGKIKYPELQGLTRMQKLTYYNKIWRNKNILSVRESNRIRQQRYKDKKKIKREMNYIKVNERGYLNLRVDYLEFKNEVE